MRVTSQLTAMAARDMVSGGLRGGAGGTGMHCGQRSVTPQAVCINVAGVESGEEWRANTQGHGAAGSAGGGP